jgi:hypothetical protein
LFGQHEWFRESYSQLVTEIAEYRGHFIFNAGGPEGVRRCLKSAALDEHHRKGSDAFFVVCSDPRHRVHIRSGQLGAKGFAS